MWHSRVFNLWTSLSLCDAPRCHRNRSRPFEALLRLTHDYTRQISVRLAQQRTAQQVGQYRCFVAEAVPKRKDKYLFEGKVWIDMNDYSVVRIEGHPAKKLSFWIHRADFVRQYQKIDGFWLPEKDQSLVQVRLYGKKILKIEHQNYVVNADQSTNARSTFRETPVTQTN